MKETYKVVIGPRVNPLFARVVWYTGKKNADDANICDVKNGNTTAPEHVKKFASSWLVAFV